MLRALPRNFNASLSCLNRKWITREDYYEDRRVSEGKYAKPGGLVGVWGVRDMEG